LFSQSDSIKNYRKYFAVGKYSGTDVAIIREYTRNNKRFFIAVGFTDIKTYLIPSEMISPVSKDWNEIMNQYSDTPYIKAINFSRQQSLPLQNAGIQHGYYKEKGITLTIDLCPSLKPLDRVIFSSIVDVFKKYKEPQPIGISITGKFLKSHPEDIKWLIDLTKSGSIEIVWINHTYNHKYNRELPIRENFLLESGTNLDSEILLLEKSLLEKEILFSAFFRFPGLVSDDKLVDQLTNYGLIPIGSDAWLAKGQIAKNGDIVLIHGNGNEPLGVTDFLTLLKKERKAIQNQQWILYDLRESIDEEFE
jgi:hypothetical protein